MINALIIVLCVIAAWWCTTGAILYLGRRPRATYPMTLMTATALLVVASLLLRLSSHSSGAVGACVGFGATLMVWGWLEMSFLLGAITGPRKSAWTRLGTNRERLRQAIGAILYHELATVAGAALVLLLTWHAPNPTALYTYLLLWAMRISAKLNLFLGVPNTGETMLPAHLKYLGTYFRAAPINRLFPWSVALATALFVALVMAAHRAPPGGGAAMRWTLLATLAGLAVLEHWMLIVPIAADAPWSAWRPARTLRSNSSTPL